MKQILIISGKGGTGKTFFTASGIACTSSVVAADCDVDAANLGMVLAPKIKERHAFFSGITAHIDPALCRQCGLCRTHCRFAAIDKTFMVDPLRCEGCGLCYELCPHQAIRCEENQVGEWFLSETVYGPLVHAELGIAEENSGKLVMQVRKKAQEIAEETKSDFIIIDGPPGIGCPVIASLSGIDLAIAVTEPTLSGLHDLKRVYELAAHFSVPVKTVINKYDINEANTQAIEVFCHEQKSEVIGRIRFSQQVSASVLKGVPLVTFCDNELSRTVRSLWEKVLQCACDV